MNKIIEMLQENTGTHMCDSGGHYGRHWERNQGVDFDAQPPKTVEFTVYNGKPEIDVTLALYHYLNERLVYNERLDNMYRASCDDYDLESATEFVALIGGIGYGGEGDPITWNTCNGESLLSQVIQYIYWEDKNGAHVLLQIHGGCDVRGGYTDPVVFDVNLDTLFDDCRAMIYCPDCDNCWDTDDGYHWYGDSNLEEYTPTDKRPSYPSSFLYIKDGKGHCPNCSGILE